MNRDERAESEALDAYLDGQVEKAASLSPELAALAAQVSSLPEQVQYDPRFFVELEQRLVARANSRRRRAACTQPAIFRRAALALAGAAAVVVFTLFILPAWLRTNQANPTMPAGPSASAIAETAMLPRPNLPILPSLSTLPVYTAGNAGLFANATPVLNATLPASPERVMIYAQQSREPLTFENARQMAERMGVTGNVYRVNSEDSQSKVYQVTNGASAIWFMDTPLTFSYVADYATVLSNNGEPLPFDQQAAIAEAFLKGRGLLDFVYRVEPVQAHSGEVRFVRLLDGRPLRENNPFDPRIDVAVTPDGKVKQIVYRALKLQPVGEYPIRSAQAAWEALTSGQLADHISVIVSDAVQPSTLQTWQRQYRPGQRADLYGYAQVLQPVEAGVSPLVSVNNLPLSGDLQTLIPQASLGQFLHIWGQMQRDASGVLTCHVSGWEPSALPDETFEGVIRRQGDRASLLVERVMSSKPAPSKNSVQAGQSLVLLDPPTNLADGARVSIRGVQVERPEPALDWWIIQTGAAASGAATGGSLSGLSLAPTDRAPTPTPFPIPYRPGDRVDGLLGLLNVTIWESPDKTRTTQIVLGVEGTWSVQLQGPGVRGIERYHNLHVRVWGKYVQERGEPAILVERYEQADPEERIQAWLGTARLITLEECKVHLFTSREGKQYVLQSSLDMPEPLLEPSPLGRPGDQILIEGKLSGKTFGGYPVIKDLMGRVAPGMRDLTGYQIQSALPDIVYKSTPADLIRGRAVVDKVELVYYTPDWQGANVPADQAGRYVQPLWSFSGYLEDGVTFEVLVQAVRDEYLK